MASNLHSRVLYATLSVLCVWQDDAVAYALEHLEERTWAVIALDEASGGRVDYTIRMNFTVVPNTNTVVDMISIGLDPRYLLVPTCGAKGCAVAVRPSRSILFSGVFSLPRSILGVI